VSVIPNEQQSIFEEPVSAIPNEQQSIFEEPVSVIPNEQQLIYKDSKNDSLCYMEALFTVNSEVYKIPVISTMIHDELESKVNDLRFISEDIEPMTEELSADHEEIFVENSMQSEKEQILKNIGPNLSTVNDLVGNVIFPVAENQESIIEEESSISGLNIENESQPIVERFLVSVPVPELNKNAIFLASKDMFIDESNLTTTKTSSELLITSFDEKNNFNNNNDTLISEISESTFENNFKNTKRENFQLTLREPGSIIEASKAIIEKQVPAVKIFNDSTLFVEKTLLINQDLKSTLEGSESNAEEPDLKDKEFEPFVENTSFMEQVIDKPNSVVEQQSPIDREIRFNQESKSVIEEHMLVTKELIVEKSEKTALDTQSINGENSQIVGQSTTEHLISSINDSKFSLNDTAIETPNYSTPSNRNKEVKFEAPILNTCISEFSIEIASQITFECANESSSCNNESFLVSNKIKSKSKFTLMKY